MKDSEKWQIRRFLELRGIELKGDLEFPDPPDAVIRSEDSCIAIEHTLILRPNAPGYNLRAFESITDNIAALAQEVFEANYDDILQVTLLFDRRIRLTNSDKAVIAINTAEVVAEFIPPIGTDWRLDSSRFALRKRPFPRAVEAIWVHNMPEWGALWSVARSTTVPDLDPETIQQHIDRKELKIDSYRAMCPEVWLLLVVEGFAPSSHWRLEQLPPDHLFEFSFDRVFLYHQFGAETQELRGRCIR